MRLVLEIERFESIEQFQIHYREWKKKRKRKHNRREIMITCLRSIAQRLTNPYCLF